MGFSVSGAAAIIFASMFIAFGAWYTAADNSFQQINEAEADAAKGSLEASNTDITITTATYNTTPTPDELEIRATNEGTEELSLNATDLLLDSELEQDWEAGATVDGDGTTDLWRPGEELVITLTPSTQPARVKLTTETGVADATNVQVIT